MDSLVFSAGVTQLQLHAQRRSHSHGDFLMHSYCKTLRYPVQIDADIECDTFFPELDSSKWRLWSQSAPKHDADMRYSFQCYVPTSASSTSERAPDLPAGLAAQHEEYQVCPAPLSGMQPAACEQLASVNGGLLV